MQYQKPPLSIRDQIALLKSRNLVFRDENEAEKWLHKISYYRLSGYMRFFQIRQNPLHTFKQNVSFTDIIELYQFDSELRQLILSAIEHLEIALRAETILQYSNNYGGWWYENPAMYTTVNFNKDIIKIDEQIGRSNEAFIAHYRRKYSSPPRPPAWMAVEIFSMGLLSRIYRGLKASKTKNSVALYFGLPTPYVLESWMHSMVYIRNICAHHGRLWNRRLTISPQQLKKPLGTWLSNKSINSNKLYMFLSCLIYLSNAIDSNTDLVSNFKILIQQYPQINLHNMGFPKNWEKEPLWR